MGMWNDTSRKAAYEQFGRDNWGWLAFWHALPKILVVVVIGLVFLGGYKVVTSPSVSAPHLAWGPVLGVAGVVVALFGVYRFATRGRRRGYRLPRSRY